MKEGIPLKDCNLPVKIHGGELKIWRRKERDRDIPKYLNTLMHDYETGGTFEFIVTTPISGEDKRIIQQIYDNNKVKELTIKYNGDKYYTEYIIAENGKKDYIVP